MIPFAITVFVAMCALVGVAAYGRAWNRRKPPRKQEHRRQIIGACL